MGIITVNARYADGSVSITFDATKIDLQSIIKNIKYLGYEVMSTEQSNASLHINDSVSINRKGIIIALGIFILMIVVIFILRNSVDLNLRNLTSGVGYGVLFILGMITSLHCISMCGGINLAVCTSYKSDSNDKISKLKPSVMYNAGRVISYTIIGGVVGSIGAAIDLASEVQGMISIIAGAFMIVMGLNMINMFPALNRIIPKIPKVFGNKIYSKVGRGSPLLIGLLTGFMPCGASQSMQMYALGTGSLISGASSMFFFSLGTVPLMFGFGVISSMLSKQFTSNMMKVCGVLIIILGAFMLLMALRRIL